MTKMVSDYTSICPDYRLHSCFNPLTYLTELQYTIAALQNTIISILENQQVLSRKLTELETTIKGNTATT